MATLALSLSAYEKNGETKGEVVTVRNRPTYSYVCMYVRRVQCKNPIKINAENCLYLQCTRTLFSH